MNVATKFVLIILFGFLTDLMLCIAVEKSCKMRGIKGKGKWGTLVFFFPIIAGIIYLCKMNKMTTADISKKPNARGGIIILLVLAVAFYSGTIYASNSIDDNEVENFFSQKFKGLTDASVDDFVHYGFLADTDEYVQYYYDMNAKRYIDNFEVPYYTEDNEKYVFEYSYDNGSGLSDCNTGEFYPSASCFVDENGNLTIDDSLYNDEHISYESFEKDGKSYYLASEVSWDSNGQMIFNDGTLIY